MVSVRSSALSRALPRRWAQGGSERSEACGGGGGEDAAAEARRAQINAEVKRTLTSLLLEVTDAMFGALLPVGAQLLVADLVYCISGNSTCSCDDRRHHFVLTPCAASVARRVASDCPHALAPWGMCGHAQRMLQARRSMRQPRTLTAQRSPPPTLCQRPPAPLSCSQQACGPASNLLPSYACEHTVRKTVRPCWRVRRARAARGGG